MSDIIESKLKNCLQEFLPVIERNFKRADKLWRAGELSKGAYDYIHQRCVVAHILVDRADIKGEQLFDIYAPITIDIKTSMDLWTEEEREHLDQQFIQWISCFDEIGFTDRQPVFEYPMKNLNNFDKRKSGK